MNAPARPLGLYANDAGGERDGCWEDVFPTLRASADPCVVLPDGNGVPRVRQLLPEEMERLMGFPDGWTRIPWRGRPAGECPSTPRKRCLGNSMCVNVMRWIGIRVMREEMGIREGVADGSGA